MTRLYKRINSYLNVLFVYFFTPRSVIYVYQEEIAGPLPEATVTIRGTPHLMEIKTRFDVCDRYLFRNLLNVRGIIFDAMGVDHYGIRFFRNPSSSNQKWEDTVKEVVKLVQDFIQMEMRVKMLKN